MAGQNYEGQNYGGSDRFRKVPIHASQETVAPNALEAVVFSHSRRVSWMFATLALTAAGPVLVLATCLLLLRGSAPDGTSALRSVRGLDQPPPPPQQSGEFLGRQRKRLVPVGDGSWARGSGSTGDRRIVDGDYLLTTERGDYMSSYVQRHWYGDVSVHTQVRVLDDYRYVGVFARSPSTAAYGGAIRSDGSLWIWQSDALGKITTLGSESTLLDVVDRDLHLQFDVFGSSLSLTAWADGEAKPDAAQISIEDDSLTMGSVVVFFTPADAVNSAAFRSFTAVPGAMLQPGDADQDLDFDQLDLVRVEQAGKYLSEERATWGDGDWNGAPGGQRGNPPHGDRRFDQADIIAALRSGHYLSGPYAALSTGPRRGDSPTSIHYDVGTGKVDLIYVPEPARALLATMAVLVLFFRSSWWRQR